MKPGQPRTYTDSRQSRYLMHFLLQIATPAVAVNFLVLARADAALSLFAIPFYDWASIACAIWALFVVHHGPFLVLDGPKRLKEKK
jgi:predicted permease